jgi:hypothetical protein
MIDEIKSIKSGPKELRECGLTVGIVLLIVGSILFFKQKPSATTVLIIGTLFCFTGVFLKKLLLPFQKVWMSIAIVLGFFMSRIVLTILFFLVITPISFIMKISKKDILDEKIDKNAKTYWNDISSVVKEKESYEKQY